VTDEKKEEFILKRRYLHQNLSRKVRHALAFSVMVVDSGGCTVVDAWRQYERNVSTVTSDARVLSSSASAKKSVM